MQKSVLEDFIKRYSLGGECECAHWYSDAEKQTLTARAHTATKTVILKVLLKKWEGVESCQLALPSSTKVKAMLGPLGDEITISLMKIRDKVANFTVSDQDCEAVCTVAEFDAFPETLDVDTAEIPVDFEVEMKLNSVFIDRLSKAVSALSEAKDFVLMTNKKGKLDMIINYEDTNTNRIRIPVETLDGKDKLENPVGLSTPILKSIIGANISRPRSPAVKVDPNAVPAPVEEEAILRVSSRGIAAVSFEDELFKSTYLMFATRIID